MLAKLEIRSSERCDSLNWNTNNIKRTLAFRNLNNKLYKRMKNHWYTIFCYVYFITIQREMNLLSTWAFCCEQFWGYLVIENNVKGFCNSYSWLGEKRIDVIKYLPMQWVGQCYIQAEIQEEVGMVECWRAHYIFIQIFNLEWNKYLMLVILLACLWLYLLASLTS